MSFRKLYHNHISLANREDLEVPTGIPPNIQPSYTDYIHARNRSAQPFNRRPHPMPPNSSSQKLPPTTVNHTPAANAPTNSFSVNHLINQYNSPFCQTSTNPSAFNLGNESWQATVLRTLSLAMP